MEVMRRKFGEMPHTVSSRYSELLFDTVIIDSSLSTMHRVESIQKNRNERAIVG